MTDEQFMASITPLEVPLVNYYRGVLRNAKDVLEIGSGWGIFARSAMMANPELRLLTVDKIPNLKEFDKNTAGYRDRITREVGDSRTVLRKIPSKSFDVVFVDGDHGYYGATGDLIDAFELVKDGGLILVDDILHHNNFKGDYGIIKAVRDLVFTKKFSVLIHPVGHGVAEIQR